MCGRFTLKTPVADWLADLFPNWNDNACMTSPSADATVRHARYNIAPSQQVAVVRCDQNGGLMLDSMRWGLVPVWADSLSVGYNMINARSETLATKPSFRPSLIDKRCVVLADGYYEWKKLTPKSKEPYWIHTRDERVFAMAGLWAENRKIPNPASNGNSILSTAIITTESNADVVSVHDRMPAMMRNETDILKWLDPSLSNANSIEHLLEQLQPSATGVLHLRKVSSIVNSPVNDSLDNILENP
jgi:putative SOS response-associated peptidase YedK